MANEFKIKNGLLVSGSITGVTESGSDNSAKMASTAWVRTYLPTGVTSSVITSALGYTPVTNARTLTINGTAYDLSADRSWTIAPSSAARVEQIFTATAGQTTFTITGGYITGLVDVFVNGVKYPPADYTATNGTTVVLGAGVLVGDIVSVINYTATIAALPTSRDVIDYTATAAQTTFTVSGGYVVGLLDVFVNGVKLTSGEVTATNGTTFVLTIASTVGDQVQAIRYNASVNGISGSGTANYLPKFTASGTIGNSAITDNGTTVTLVSRALSGTTASFSGSLLSNDATFNGGVVVIQGNNAELLLGRASTSYISSITLLTNGTNKWNIGMRSTGGTENFFIYNSNLSANNLTINSSTGAATFSSSVTATQGTFSSTAGNQIVAYYGVSDYLNIQHNGLTTKNNQMNLGTNLNSTPTMALVGSNVGIGTTSPAAPLTIRSAGATGILLEEDINNSGVSSRLVARYNGGTGTLRYDAGGWRFNTGATIDATSGTERALISQDGYFRMLSGTNGIQFQGATGSANALNYYEEGTWTPTLQNATVTYSYRSASYVRIGNYVFVRWGIRINTISGQSGTVTISGLPFTAVNWGSYQEPNISVSTGGLSTADYAQRARVYKGGGDASLYGRIANNGDTPWNTGEILAGSWIIGEIYYNIV